MDDINRLLVKLRRLLRSRGRSIDDTDDLIQEAFLRLQLYCRDHTVQKIEAFLVRTALNLSADQRKHERVIAILHGALDDLAIADPSPTPDAVCTGRERLLRLKAGLDELRPRRREIFLLNRIEGYSFVQIAQRLGITLSAVEKNAAKAVLFLTDWMDEKE